MADTHTFIATHFRQDPDQNRVGHLRILAKNPSGDFEDRELVAREDVVEMLKGGQNIFVWDYENENIGEMIDLVGIQGETYLRLDAERLCADNLGDLPSV